MKTLIWILVTVLIGSVTYIRPSRLVDGRFELFDENWDRKGYVIQNWLEPGRFDVFDENWERKGFWQKADDGWDRQDQRR